MEVDGTVLLKFHCSADGFPKKVELIEENPTEFGFGMYASEFLKTMNFKDKMKYGEHSIMYKRISFELKERF